MCSKITIFNMTLPAYGAIALIGIAIVTLFGILTVWSKQLCTESFFKLECTGGASAFIGAKLLDMIVTSLQTEGFSLSLSSFMDSGLSYYGGLAFGLLGVCITSFILHVNLNLYAKNLIFLVPLLHSIWKIGCFMGGCCYGIPYDGVCAVVFPEGVKAPAGIPLFPTEVLEAGISFATAVIFYIRGRKAQWKHPIAEYIGWYSIIRFFVEFLRYRGSSTIFSAAQKISVACIFLVVLCFCLEKRNGYKEENQ